jgi:hypothetical protein
MRRTTGYARAVLRRIAATPFVALVAACGGGGDDGDLGPLWVETDVQIADIDGDSRADVLTIALRRDNGQDEGHLMLYRQTTPGTFAAPVSTTVGAYPWRIAVADIDGDGAPDLVITDPGAGVVWLLLQDATSRGRFLAPHALVSGVTAYSAAVADLNQDGAPDVAVKSNANAGRAITVRYQNAAQRGTFGAPVDVALSAFPGALAAGDVDGDGRTDLLAHAYTTLAGVANDPVAGLMVLFQQPGGGFVDSGVLASQVGLNSDRVAIADANGDGRPDLLAALSPWSADFSYKLLVVPQTAARAFGTPVETSLAAVRGNLDAVFTDLNQDGGPDVAVAGFWGEGSTWRARANVLLNDGSAAFALTAAVDVPIAVSTLAAGDLNGDGRKDIVLYGDEQCMVMYQSSTPGVFLPPRALR